MGYLRGYTYIPWRHSSSSNISRSPRHPQASGTSHIFRKSLPARVSDRIPRRFTEKMVANPVMMLPSSPNLISQHEIPLKSHEVHLVSTQLLTSKLFPMQVPSNQIIPSWSLMTIIYITISPFFFHFHYVPMIFPLYFSRSTSHSYSMTAGNSTSSAIFGSLKTPRQTPRVQSQSAAFPPERVRCVQVQWWCDPQSGEAQSTKDALLKPLNIWGFPTMGLPQNGWFMKENPIKMDDLI